jgi:predicted HTH transcriptional regulator
LYGQLLPDNFEPFPKNPHIIQIFTQIGRSEELGTGIRNVYKYTKVYSGKDNIEFDEKDIFITQVPLGDIFTDKTFDIIDERGAEKLGEKLGENQKKIIKLMQENKFIPIPELSQLLKISETAIQNNIAKLKSRKAIERIGTNKGGYWKIKQQEDIFADKKFDIIDGSGMEKLDEKLDERLDERLDVKLDERLDVKLGENQKKIIKSMQENKFITIPELSQLLKISETAIQNNIAKLKSRGFIERKGADRGGYWNVNL